MEGAARFFVRFKGWIIGFWVFLALGSLGLLGRLSFQNDVNFFFPKGDTDFAFLQRYQKAFGSDDAFLLIAIKPENPIFTQKELAKIRALEAGIEALPLSTEVTSIASAKDFLVGPVGPVPYDLLPSDRDPSREEVQNVLKDPRLVNALVNPKGTVFALFVRTKNDYSHSEAEEFVRLLKIELTKAGYEKAAIAGRATTQVLFVNRTKVELGLYTGASILVLLLALVAVYRRARAVLVCMLSVIIGLFVFFGLLGAVGLKLDLMSPLYPILMLIFGIEGVIHLMQRYAILEIKLKDRVAAISQTLRELLLPVFLITFTTAVGFLALLFNNIEPVRQFGIYSAVGVMLAYVIFIFFSMPLLACYSGSSLLRGSEDKIGWPKFMAWIGRVNLHNKPWIIGVVVIMTTIGAVGASMVKTNTKLLSDLAPSDPIRKDFEMIESELGGIRTFEIAILPGKNLTATSPEVLRATDAAAKFLENRAPTTSVTSPITFFASLNKAQSGGDWEAYKLPQTDEEINGLAGMVTSGPAKAFTRLLIGENGQISRITARIRDQGSDSVAAVNRDFRTWAASNVDTSIATFRITGLATLVDKNHEYMRKDLMYGLVSAYLVICITLLLIYKTWRVFVVAIVPNTLPLMLAAAAMGYLSIELKASTSIIFTISYGVAVNNTIFMMNTFLRIRKRGVESREAIPLMLAETGQAVIISSLMLLAGFVSLLFSSFITTFYIGLLTFITVGSALISDMFITPQMLLWLYKKPIEAETTTTKGSVN
jgi:hypothetical protein